MWKWASSWTTQDLWEGKETQVTVLKHGEPYKSAFILAEFALVSGGSSVSQGQLWISWAHPPPTGICQCCPRGQSSAAGEEGGLRKEAVDRPLPAQRSHWKSRKLAGAWHGCDLWSSEALQLPLGALGEASGQREPPLDSSLAGSWGRRPEETRGNHSWAVSPPQPRPLQALVRGTRALGESWLGSPEFGAYLCKQN